MMLEAFLQKGRIEAGCDEAGRGCLSGPVFAAAVILPEGFEDALLNDSKKLNEKQRASLRPIIEQQALAWAVASVSAEEIDHINILNASFLAMHRAIAQLKQKPEFLLIDGNRFYQPEQLPLHKLASKATLPNEYAAIPYACIIKGDGRFKSIAAASILAKTHRDECMMRLHARYPQYAWDLNKGYPTQAHREALHQYGPSPEHRKSFHLKEDQLRLF